MRQNWVLIAWIVVPVVLLGGILTATLLQSPGRGPDIDRPGHGPRTDNELAAVRSTLAKQADLATCKSVLSRLNAHLRQAKDHAVPSLGDADRARLKSDLGLTDDEVAEVAAGSFTALDAHHLETCFLLRDAAASLEVTAPAPKGTALPRLTPLERAEAGFAWVCRQVRLADQMAEPAPVAFALRRGWGSAFERSALFLALLEQFGQDEGDESGLQGCLIGWMEGERFRLWACGVTVGAKPDALYLFDPRLGLPVPGPGGKGIATLAQAQADPTVLTQLDADKLKYDVTPEQVSKAEAQLITPLSSAAPRMLLLQNVLLRDRTWEGRPLPAAVRVKLAETPSVARDTIRAASGKAAVRFLPGGAGLLRRSLPKAEGGTDEGMRVSLADLPGFAPPNVDATIPVSRQQWLHLTAVPWPFFPDEFRDVRKYTLNAGIGRDLRQMFQVPFLRHFSDPAASREQMLRGRLSRVTSEQMAKEQAQWRAAAEMPDLPPRERKAGIEAWEEKADRVYADVLEGKLAEADARTALGRLYGWKAGEVMEVVMSRAIGVPKAAEATHQLALCMHERATRLRLRHALAKRSELDLPDERQRAEQAYEGAESWWRDLIAMQQKHPRLAPYVASARILLGEALWERGQKEKAVALWKDVSAPQSDVQKLGSLWRARRAER